MAAESLSPVALNSKTLATGPLQHKHAIVLHEHEQQYNNNHNTQRDVHLASLSCWAAVSLNHCRQACMLRMV